MIAHLSLWLPDGSFYFWLVTAVFVCQGFLETRMVTDSVPVAIQSAKIHA